jgi:hypothetical protein
VLLCNKRGDAAREILQASASCFALLALSGIQACFRERECVWAAVGSGLVFCVRVVLGVFSCSCKIFESIVTLSFVFSN